MSSQDFMHEFIEDMKEHIQGMEKSLLVLEREGNNKEEIGEVFRLAHSIKGASAYMGFEHLANLTHELESLISRIQKESRPIPPRGISTLLECVDFISHAMTHLLEKGEEPPFPSSLLQNLQNALSAKDMDDPHGAASSGDGDGGNGAGVQVGSGYDESERFSLFLGSLREKYWELVNLFTFSLELNLSEPDFDRARDLIHSLITSCVDVKQHGMEKILKELEDHFLRSYEKGTLERYFYADLLNTCGQGLQSVLPTLELPSLAFVPEATEETEETEESEETRETEALRAAEEVTALTQAVAHEEDQELLNIFLETFKEHFGSLASLTPSSPDAALPYVDLERAREVIRKLITSTRYMDYGPVVEGLETWEKSLVDEYASSPVVGLSYRDLMETYRGRFQEMLPGLELPSVPVFSEEAPQAAGGMEEEDEELLSIFLETFKDHFSALATFTPPSPEAVLSSSDLERSMEAIRKLISSAHYMDYGKLVEALEEWEKSLAESHQSGAVDGRSYVELLRGYGQRFEQMLPRLRLPELPSFQGEPDVPIVQKEEDDEDEELVRIFIDAFKEQFAALVTLAPGSAEAVVPESDLDAARASIRKLISSSRYMDYEPVVQILEGWEESLSKAQGNGGVEGRLYGDLLNARGRELEQALEGLQLPALTSFPPAEATVSEAIMEEQEEDEELLSIFFDTFREHLSTLATLTPALPEESLSNAEVDRARDSIKRLISSARYMDYDQIVHALEKWELSLGSPPQGRAVDGYFYSDLLAAKGEELQGMLPGLQVRTIIPPGYEKKPDLAFPGIEAGAPVEARGLWEGPATGFTDADFEGVFPGSQPPLQAWTRPGEEKPRPVEEKRPKEPFIKRPEKRAAGRGRASAVSEEAAASATLRVDAQKVDQLLNQVGELVVRRSEFQQAATYFRELFHEFSVEGKLSKQDLRRLKSLGLMFNESTMSLGRVTSDLQDSVMRVRMLPISQLFQRFPRVVRDQALKLGKMVELLMDGGETEVDKRVLEQMYDPLVQFLRNAIVHGIESPEERVAAGKPETGTVLLSAYHEGDYVVLKIEDDGRGIDVQKLKRILRSRGEMSTQELDNLSDRELMHGIFLPGISTHDSVDGTAGRGVGLDVVKENVERMNGSIEIDSYPGMGARFTIRIPLTLAIIRALLVKGASQVFTVPIRSISEILRFNPDDTRTIEGLRVLSIRDKTIPVVHLGGLLNAGDDNLQNGHKFVVIVNTSFREVGLVVDGLIGEREVVIKPIEDDVHAYEGFSGATILGDGTVSLILDVSALLKMMKGNWGEQSAIRAPRLH